MRINSFAKSDIGQRRKNNEDYFVCHDEIGLYAVCDGVGGHEAGEVASETAGTTMTAYLATQTELLDMVEDTRNGHDMLRKLATEAVQRAGKRVFELGQGRSHKRMATTATALIVAGNKAVMGHVGDSRLYLVRAAELHQLSEDHTYLNELLRRGELVVEEGQKHPFGNVVTRALGQTEMVRVDSLVFDVLPGDTYLLCSDGLTAYVTDPAELVAILSGEDPHRIATELVDLANARGGHDNITALVVRAEAGGEEFAAEADRTDEVTLQQTTLTGVSLFRHLTHREVVEVQHAAEVVTARAGETVFEEGTTGDSLHIILRGRLRVTRGSTLIRELQAGSHVGEMALLSARPRSATVRVDEDVRMLVISRDAFTDLVRRNQSLGIKLLWSFAQVLSFRLDETTALLMTDPTVADSAMCDATVETPFDPNR